MQLWKAVEEFANDGFIDIFVKVLLDEDFLEIRCELQTLEQMSYSGFRCSFVGFDRDQPR